MDDRLSGLPLVIEAAVPVPLHLGSPDLILVDLSANRYVSGHIGRTFRRGQADSSSVSRLRRAATAVGAAWRKAVQQLGHRADAVYVVYDDDGNSSGLAASSGCSM